MLTKEKLDSWYTERKYNNADQHFIKCTPDEPCPDCADKCLGCGKNESLEKCSETMCRDCWTKENE